MKSIHKLLCDIVNLIFPKPIGEEYTWTKTELSFIYGFLLAILAIVYLASNP